MPQPIHKSKPRSTQIGRLVDMLIRVQIFIAREDPEGAWLISEQAIELLSARH